MKGRIKNEKQIERGKGEERKMKERKKERNTARKKE